MNSLFTGKVAEISNNGRDCLVSARWTLLFALEDNCSIRLRCLWPALFFFFWLHLHPYTVSHAVTPDSHLYVKINSFSTSEVAALKQNAIHCASTPCKGFFAFCHLGPFSNLPVDIFEGRFYSSKHHRYTLLLPYFK